MKELLKFIDQYCTKTKEKKEASARRLLLTHHTYTGISSHLPPPPLRTPHPKTINEKFTGRLIASKNLIRGGRGI